MLYVAGKSDGKLKLPVSDVRALLDSPVASFVTDTIAPGMSAPPGSTTVPESVPVVVWARSGAIAMVNNVTPNKSWIKLPIFQERCLEFSIVLRHLDTAGFLIDVFSLVGFVGNKKAALGDAYASARAALL